jgi:enamine deaminase RidA (YjgF/YER057c/UK114 family)
MARPAAPPRPAPHIAAPQRPAPNVARPNVTRPNVAGRPAPAARTAAPQAQSQGTNAQPARPLTRVQQRQERAAERAALRGVPRAQRAERLQQFRADRAAQRAGVTPNRTAPNALRANSVNGVAVNNNARRLNGQARITPQQAQQGRFAARFAARQAALNANGANANRRWSRPAFGAARGAWRAGRVAGFTPWFGPVFYPYAYSDIFDYTFWPAGYDAGYWDYAYDDFFDGVFYGTAPVDYGYGAAPPAQPQASYAAVQQLCKQPGNGVTSWPIAEISQKVGLNPDQQALLNDMKAAAQKAAQAFSASCPAENAFPSTPPGRLDAMTARLEATLNAVDDVKPALDKFYASLSDEQKERFNELGPKNPPKPAETTASGDTSNGNTCADPKPGLTNLPIERIEDAVQPNDRQQAGLKNLEDATNQAVQKLAAACPDQTPLTPPGRLDAMGQRLSAMIDAAKTVKPALEDFYGSLSNEQKARFNAIGRTLAADDKQ